MDIINKKLLLVVVFLSAFLALVGCQQNAQLAEESASSTSGEEAAAAASETPAEEAAPAEEEKPA